MRQISAQIITWDPREDETYLNGSQLKLTKQGVIFKNDLMSPGKALVTWHSQQNYQASRRLAKLPLLQRGAHYKIKLKADLKTQGALYVKLSFYSRFGELLATEFIKEKTGSFTYPKDAYEYKLELINAGVKEVHFEYVLLADAQLELGDDYCYQSTPPLTDELAVVFSEPTLRAILTVPRQKGTMIFSALKAEVYYKDEIAKQIATLFESKKKLAFVGNGPLSDLVAVKYGAKYDLPAFVTTKAAAGAGGKVSVYYHDVVAPDKLAQKLYINNVAYDNLRVK